MKRLSWVVIQEGGSSTEFYAHGFNTIRQAQAYRRVASRASYRTSPPIDVRGFEIYPKQEPEFLEVMANVAKSTTEFEYIT